MPVPLLIFSDSPTGSTGLGRICRELAMRIHTDLSDVFRVATIGINSQYSSRLPFPQYSVGSVGPSPELPRIITDFFNGQPGILFSILNPGWLEWLAYPEAIEGNPELKQCLTSGLVKRWIYAPIDAEGPKGMPVEIATILDGFDRRLFYTQWASELYAKAKGLEETPDHLPHGIQGHVFYPRDRKVARETFVSQIGHLPFKPIGDDVMLVGVVATNTARKDWPLAFETCARLLDSGKNVYLWAHTDRFFGTYDFHNLTHTFGMNHRVIPTCHYLSSDKLAWAYSACDVILAPGSEGWGLTIAESLACGTPVVHGNYGGATTFVPESMLVDPYGWHHEGIYCHKRPIFSAHTWAGRVLRVVPLRDGKSMLSPQFYWDKCWEDWQYWLEDGIR